MEFKHLSRNYNDIIKITNHNHFKKPGDAVAPVMEMLTAIINAGYTEVGVTDHGSFNSIQNINHLIREKKLPLRVIYGIEAYIELPKDPNLPEYSIQDKVSHCIMYAKTEEGKHILDKLNSKTTNYRFGNPVITWEELKKHVVPGTIVATSACIAGAPATQLFRNDFLNNKHEKFRKKQAETITNAETNETEPKYISPNNIDYQSTKWDLAKKAAKLSLMKSELNNKDSKEELKNLKRQRRIAEKANDNSTLESLNYEIENYENKQAMLKLNIENARTDIRMLNKKYKYLSEKVSGWIFYQQKIDEIEAEKISDEDCYQNAKLTAKLYNDIFGAGNYFMEVQYHGMPAEKFAYQTLAKIAGELDIPLIAANDAHMPTKETRSLNQRNVSKYLYFSKIDENPWDAELYVKTPNELALALSKILSDKQVDEAMMNLNKLSNMITYEEKVEAHYPVYDKNRNSAELLREICYKNIDWRYPNRIGWDNEHEKRLKYELDVIISMGFADYHLIVKDFLEYGRIIGNVPIEELPNVPLTIEGAKKYVNDHGYDIGIGIGLGRGSGAGSLVTFLLGITGIDPFKFGLIFERFLNPERISMPDIDSDFAIGVREKTIDYVKATYGSDAVVGIITENREGVKGAIRDAARYLGYKEYENDKYFLTLGNTIRKKVPTGPNISFSSVVSTISETNETTGETEVKNITIKDNLLNEFSSNPDAIDIINIAENLEGMLCSYGQHAAGVIIYDDSDITDYIPVRRSAGNENIKVTECDKVESEEIKLLKMDFLGLKTLSILTDTARMVYKNHGIKIDFNKIPIAGPEAQIVLQDIYAKGKTKDVFQFESAGMRKYLKQLMNN